MRFVFQSCVDPDRGDCHRAVIASLFELELEQVPNFRLFSDELWYKVYWFFLNALGWEYNGCAPAKRHIEDRNYGDINGFYYADVKSRTFPGRHHSVVIDAAGKVVHDPNPSQAFIGVNVVETGELCNVHIIERKK